MKKRNPAARKAEVLTVALGLAEKSHYLKVTRTMIADALGITPQAVRHYFATMPQLHGDLVRAAIKQKKLKVVAQAITAKDSRTRKLDADFVQEALGAFA